MKTLLLALAVVAFVCLGSGPPFTLCFECNRMTSSDCSTASRCYRGSCYTLYRPDENCELKWAVKGCAQTCPTAGPNERVKCCRSPRCNDD